MIEQQIDIPTKDGHTTTFISHPERDGPHPVILFYMDAPGIREELRDMARRLASVGYYVMLPNLYYRSNVMELGPLPPPNPDAPERKRMMELMGSLTVDKIMHDTDALLAHAETQPAASRGPIGCGGYCMNGQYAGPAAARYPGRVAAGASIYGVLLMTDKPDSPHLAARQTKAELYFGCAEVDRWMPLEMIEPLRTSLKAADVDAEVELYPGVEHGFAFPARPAYNKAAAERHWARLFSLFKRE